MLPNLEGKVVRGSDGARVGKVVRMDDDGIVVESGFFKVRGVAMGLDEVASFSATDVFLRRPGAQYAPDARPGPGAESPWRTGQRGADAREEMEALERADREHRLGAQANPELREGARSSYPPGAEQHHEDRLASVERFARWDRSVNEAPRGQPPEARMPPLEHPEDEKWP
jgi:hypothetical protein